MAHWKEPRVFYSCLVFPPTSAIGAAESWGGNTSKNFFRSEFAEGKMGVFPLRNPPELFPKAPLLLLRLVTQWVFNFYMSQRTYF